MMKTPIRFVLPLAAGLLCGPQAFAASPLQTSFASPQAAADALAHAVQAHDKPALRAMFGKDGERLISSGDAVADRDAGQAFTEAYAQSHSLAPQPDGSEILIVGSNDWPFPIPLEQRNGKWQFNTAAGLQQVLDRRVGQNELLTIQTLLAAADAEQDYFNRVQRGTGTGAYAAKFFSTPSEEDGLYWDAGPGDPPSPLAPLVATAESEGYPGAAVHNGKQMPYQGYYFHILKGQGPDASGGAIDYLQNGRMTGGFGIVAWPARYGNSGIMTFVINQDGTVFQKDLGKSTDRLASGMTLFNPDTSWTQVDLSQ